MDRIQDTPINEPLFCYISGMLTTAAIVMSPAALIHPVDFVFYWVVVIIFAIGTWALAFK